MRKTKPPWFLLLVRHAAKARRYFPRVAQVATGLTDAEANVRPTSQAVAKFGNFPIPGSPRLFMKACPEPECPLSVLSLPTGPKLSWRTSEYCKARPPCHPCRDHPQLAGRCFSARQGVPSATW